MILLAGTILGAPCADLGFGNGSGKDVALPPRPPLSEKLKCAANRPLKIDAKSPSRQLREIGVSSSSFWTALN
jgi:hypothetical protein